MAKNILCSISTRGRYHTTLPMTLMSVANQTKPPDKLVVFDDNENPIDVREIQHYAYIFQILELKGIQWEWLFAQKKGQHFNHEMANNMGYTWVWRLDDDTVAEANTLETLYSHVNNKVGAIGGAVLTPPIMQSVQATGKIEDIDNEANLQWAPITSMKQVDHLHCSFLYRAGVANYCLDLSKVAHREETLFTYELTLKGYENYVVPNATVWHLKNKEGGIRDGQAEMFAHDENIFRTRLKLVGSTVVVLDCGMGDHVVFKHVLPEIQNPLVFSCFPEIVPGRSIAEAHQLLGSSIGQYNIYGAMDRWKWKGSLEDAFRKMYLK